MTHVDLLREHEDTRNRLNVVTKDYQSLFTSYEERVAEVSRVNKALAEKVQESAKADMASSKKLETMQLELQSRKVAIICI